MEFKYYSYSITPRLIVIPLLCCHDVKLTLAEAKELRIILDNAISEFETNGRD